MAERCGARQETALTVGNPGPRTFGDGISNGPRAVLPFRPSHATTRAPPAHRWPPDAPRVGIHLGVGGGCCRPRGGRAHRRHRAADLHRQPDRLATPREPPARSREFIAYAARQGSPHRHPRQLPDQPRRHGEPFATQSRLGLIHEMQRAPAYGATVVNTHIGSHRGGGHAARPARASSRTWRSAGTTRRRASRWSSRTRPAAATTSARDRGAGRDPGRRPPRRWRIAWPSAWTPPTCGARGYDISARPRAPCGARPLRRADRAGSAGAGPSQRLAVVARLTDRPARAPGGRDDRPAWPGRAAARPAAAADDLRDGDAGRRRGL